MSHSRKPSDENVQFSTSYFDSIEPGSSPTLHEKSLLEAWIRNKLTNGSSSPELLPQVPPLGGFLQHSEPVSSKTVQDSPLFSPAPPPSPALFARSPKSAPVPIPNANGNHPRKLSFHMPTVRENSPDKGVKSVVGTPEGQDSVSIVLPGFKL